MGTTISSHFGRKTGFRESKNMQNIMLFEAIGAHHMEVIVDFFSRWSILKYIIFNLGEGNGADLFNDWELIKTSITIL